MQRFIQSILCLMATALFISLMSVVPGKAQGPAPFGNGEQNVLRYAGETGLKNYFLFSLGAETGYDDNVLSNNAFRRGEGFVGISPRISFGEERKAVDFTVDYTPSFEIYQKTTGYNRLNHALGLNFDFRLSSHWRLKLRDNAIYANGIFQPNSGQSFLPGQGPPTSLNPNIYTPLARQLGNESRLDLIYQKSYRTSLSLSGGYLLSQYTNVSTGPQSLLNTRGWYSGLQYTYRLSKRTTLGTQYLLNNYTFEKQSRAIVHSVYFSLAHQFSPTVALQIFAGPQYSRQTSLATNLLPFPVGPVTGGSIFSDSWNTAAGGTLTKQAGKTALALSAQRVTSNGGGLLALVTSNVATFDVRRRLARRWDASIDLMDSYQTQIVGLSVAKGVIRSQQASASLDHSLAKGLTMRFYYSYLHQRTQGSVVYLANVDRNHASVGIFYDLGKFPLGR